MNDSINGLLARGVVTGNNSDAGSAASVDGFERKQAMKAELERLGEVMGEFKAYDSQLGASDIAGTRVVTCLYKATKDSKTGELIPAKWDNSYCRIPVAHLTEKAVIAAASELAPFVVAYLQGIEDAMIKDAHKAGQLRIYTDGLSLARLIEKLEESSNAGRLNKERIGQWFDSQVSEILAVKFAAKMGLDENSSEAQLAKLEAVLQAYKAKFESLAGGKAFIVESDCIAMINVIKSCELEDDSLGSRFMVRLENMSKKDDDLLLAL